VPSPAFRRRGWPCAGYFDPANPVTDSSVFCLGVHASKCPRSNDRMIGRTLVMNMQYKPSERMDLLTVERTYIQRRKKIKNKLAILRKTNE
jgi:hypothetical protein